MEDFCRTCKYWDATPKWRIDTPHIDMGPDAMKRTCLAMPPTPWIDPDGNQQELYPRTFSAERCGQWKQFDARLTEVLPHAPPHMRASLRVHKGSSDT